MNEIHTFHSHNLSKNVLILGHKSYGISSSSVFEKDIFPLNIEPYFMNMMLSCIFNSFKIMEVYRDNARFCLSISNILNGIFKLMEI